MQDEVWPSYSKDKPLASRPTGQVLRSRLWLNRGRIGRGGVVGLISCRAIARRIAFAAALQPLFALLALGDFLLTLLEAVVTLGHWDLGVGGNEIEHTMIV